MNRLATYARQLVDAEQSAAPITSHHEIETLADGYAVQNLVVRRKLADGLIPVGWKIGLTNSTAQMMFNAFEPIRGVLFETMRFMPNQSVPVSRFIAPKVEVELAFVLKDALAGPNCTVSDVVEATDYIVPAIEVIDNRLSRHPILGVLISDNAGAAGFVLGSRKILPAEVDLRDVAASVKCNGVLVGSGVSGTIMGHPSLAVAWLANALAKRGQHLTAGSVIMAGAFIGPIPVNAGDTIVAEFGANGAVSIAFE